MLRRVLPDVADLGGTSGHAQLELTGEGGQGRGRHAERLESGEAEPHAERHRPAGVERGDRVEQGDQPPQQLPARVPVVDAQCPVRARVRVWPGHQGGGLDVAELQRGVDLRDHGAPQRSSTAVVCRGPRGGAAAPAVRGGFSRRPVQQRLQSPGAAAPPRRRECPAPAGTPSAGRAPSRPASPSARDRRERSCPPPPCAP